MLRLKGASTGVEDEPRRWAAGIDGHAEGVADQLGSHEVGQGAAHHPAGGEIDDRGQVGPALPGPDVGDVAEPGARRR